MPGVWAILLAAGESSRMGQLKALLPWRHTSLIEHQLRSLLDAGVEQVVVVIGHDAERLKPIIEAVDGATWALNNDYLQGKTTAHLVDLDEVNDAVNAAEGLSDDDKELWVVAQKLLRKSC